MLIILIRHNVQTSYMLRIINTVNHLYYAVSEGRVGYNSGGQEA